MDREPYRDHVSAAMTVIFNRDGKRHNVVRKYLFRAIRQVTPTIERDKDGIRYFLDTSDTGVGLKVFTDGSFEEAEMDDILRLVLHETGRSLSNSTFIDIGANIGTTTALALKKHGAAHVVAFEPEQRNHELLQMLIIANALEGRVEAHRLALSDIQGEGTMELSDTNAGDHRVRMAPHGAPHAQVERSTTAIRLTKLDEFDIDYANVSLVWMDVQGHEGHVLAGASRLLATNVPILAEYCPYMLLRAGGLELFHSIVRDNFRTVIDVRSSARLPAIDLAQLASQYRRSSSFTDLLLLH